MIDTLRGNRSIKKKAYLGLPGQYHIYQSNQNSATYKTKQINKHTAENIKHGRLRVTKHWSKHRCASPTADRINVGMSSQCSHISPSTGRSISGSTGTRQINKHGTGDLSQHHHRPCMYRGAT